MARTEEGRNGGKEKMGDCSCSCFLLNPQIKVEPLFQGDCETNSTGIVKKGFRDTWHCARCLKDVKQGTVLASQDSLAKEGETRIKHDSVQEKLCKVQWEYTRKKDKAASH
jgi:hypothetical protein